MTEQHGEPQTQQRSASRTPEEIEEELARTREELGQTVEALTAKLDVKQRATDKARLVWADHQPVVVGAGVAAGALVVILIWRRFR